MSFSIFSVPVVFTQGETALLIALISAIVLFESWLKYHEGEGRSGDYVKINKR